MGLGFNLGMILIVLPLTIILGISYAFTEKKLIGRGLLALWSFVIFIVILSLIVQHFTKTIELTTEDYHREYIIDRRFFHGKQADWQYNHYRFTIDKKNTFTLYEKDDNDSTHIFYGKISTVTPYSSARLIIDADSTYHHFFKTNPTTIRKGKKFYLVFESAKFSNMFFIKGKWKPLK